MRAYRMFSLVVTLLFLLMAAGINVYLLTDGRNKESYYLVEAKRVADDISETGSYDLSQYPHIIGVFSEDDGDIYKSSEHYVIVRAGGRLYRVEYIVDNRQRTVIAVDIVLGALFAVMVGLLIYLRRNIIIPFGNLSDVPKELARGNLAVPIHEQKSRYFGKFIWGVDMLRETIENSRKKEISMQRDKKLLLLSLSHDIKTPLSAIKLNAKALAKGLYKEEEKRIEAAENINKRADEIEHFVSEITKASSEDFMNFEVVQGEVFLSEVIERLLARYASMLSVRGTELAVGKYDNCLLSCDEDRLAECLQNLFENAIKYGDGRRIALSCEEVDGCELITVSNTGCTLEEQELTQIFESFHRGSNTDNIGGNGLGLFICKRLMGLMGGEVFAEISGDEFRATLVVSKA